MAAPPVTPSAAIQAPTAPPAPPAVGSPDPPAPREPRRRNSLLLLLVLVAVVGVLGLVALIASMVSDSPSSGPAAGPAASTQGTLTDPTGPVASSAPGSVPPGGSAADGLAVVAAVVSPTTIEVVEVVHWPDGGPATIELELSDDAASSGGLSIAPESSVESLQVSVDGSPVIATLRDGSTNRWSITPPSGAAPGSMEVRYLLVGAIVRSVPSSPGRALAVITPISSGLARDLPVSMAISAANVLNVYCPTGANQATIMCGRLDGDRWVVTPPPGLPLVVAQVNLPAPI